MRLLFKFFVVALLGVLIALAAYHDPGYVLVTRGPWVLETSVALLIVVFALAFIGLYALLRFAAGARETWRSVERWSGHRRALRARRELTRGLIELAERHWPEAERHLTRHVSDSDTPLLNYLAAASAAQEQGAHERRDKYLYSAHESMPAADVAVGLTQADLQIRHRQMEQALATLMHLRQIAPKHTHVLKLLARLYLELRDWTHLQELLPELKRREVLSAEQYDALEAHVHTELLRKAARLPDAQAIDQLWRDVPKRLRGDASLVRIYAERLIAAHEGARAAEILRDTLKRSWNDHLVYLYGLAELEDAPRQLSQAEGWLKDHPRDPTLLLTLGRLGVRNRLWGKAQQYLEASVAAGASPEAYRALGDLLADTGDTRAAAECYRKGLALADDTERRKLLSAAAEEQPARALAVL